MATKLQYISELSDFTTDNLSEQPLNWTSFLKTAAYNYKYSFHDQVLIYAQKPDSIACAEIDVWNKLGRWVNKGSKGIALIVEKQGKLNLRHVFDLGDTNSYYDNDIKLWELTDKYNDLVIEHLQNTFGELQNTTTTSNALISTAHNSVQDNLLDYISELVKNRSGSFLEEFDDFNVELIFKNEVKNSVAYILLTRCGYDADNYFTSDDFKNVINFNTSSAISILGSATSDISEMILISISESIKAMEREEKLQHQKFEKDKKVVHNVIDEDNERSDENEINLQGRGRISDSKPDDSTGGSAHREIRNATQDISQEPHEGNLFKHDTVWETDTAFSRNRPDSKGESRADDVSNGGNNKITRQDERAIGMGANDEQFKELSGGNSVTRVSLQLGLFPTEEQQINIIEQAENEKGSAFSISQEDIDSVLQSGSGFQDGKYRIYEYFTSGNAFAKDCADYLKHEYGTGGGTHFYPDGVRGGQWHDAKGIGIEKFGSFTNPDKLLKWNEVAKRIGELISLERYLNEKEKEHLPIYDQEQNEKRLQYEEEQAVSAILSQQPTEKKEITYEFHLGDAVYLGADKFEILAYDENVVRLFDTRFPLMNKEIPREEFERKLRENPINSHLMVNNFTPQLSIVDTQSSIWDNYQNVKAEYPDCIVAYQVGDFFEFMGEDANNVSKMLEITLVTRIIGEDEHIPMCGVPKHTLETYTQKLIEDGFNVALHGLDEISGEAKTIRVLSVTDKQHLKTENIIEEEPITPVFEEPKTISKVATYDIHPEIPLADRRNFKITDNELGLGGPKEKYRNNIEAIKILFKVENENRFASPEEQEGLSRYVGWGGIPEAFDEHNVAWTNEYIQLKALISESEYSDARESTLNAFYTPPIVIHAIYQAVENMGFKKGNILEPSCGIGNFLGMLPESMADCKLYGVELDSISGRIAQQLYQKSSITVQGYEKTNLPDSFFDVAIGNVPFGQYKIADKRYDKNNFLVHDYFFEKTLDKVRPGGIVAFITSSGTMDKKNPAVRKYIAQRADLLGVIRLPNTAFKANAGTEVTSDIIFLQKRDRMVDIEPDWIHLGKDENNITINQYFIDNPEMILGEMVMESTQYGMDSTCRPYEDTDLSELLQDAIVNIHAEVTEYEVDDISNENVETIPADPNVKNFSYAIVDGDIYFRENSLMNRVETSLTAVNRIKGMIEIRDCVRNLITYQTEDYSDETIKNEQSKLNNIYDKFINKYGVLNSRANNIAFSDDSSYCLLCSLEILDENGELAHKADMFTKRTIKQHIPVTYVDTASEALAVSLGEKAKIDIPFMSQLTGQSEDELTKELEGVIFRNPQYISEDSRQTKFLTADEYLSGNVREKLDLARRSAELYPEDYTVNVKALEKVQPIDLTASEITVRLGATWIPPDVIQDFMFEFLETPRYSRWNIKVHYSNLTGEWNIEGKSQDRGNIKAISTYGTSRINAYKIIEETLNLRDVRIFDYVENENGNKTAVLNKKETTVAQQKQEMIKTAFCEWLWQDPDRRGTLTRLYNDKFNNLRPREFDGSHLKFSGMNPEISLRPHQVNAIAHILYGGNTLLAHVVGAGKTYEMIAAAMESKRLGLCHKPLFVVPNHITEQFASEFLQLYPSANILIATKKDFETKNRKKFCGRIATGDYDAVIIGHSQFEKIPMSIERQSRLLQQQLNEIVGGIDELKRNRGERFSIKQLEKTKKSIQLKLDKLNDQSRKDDIVTFEELGVDRLFIDESHYYKNLFLYTKMRNVGGIAQTEAQKSSDLFMKCRYLDEITDGRGIIFATGTPISNSMVELYTVQRYLQYNTLVKNGLQHFDAWASTFGETVTAIELAPEGTGYRAKTRFAKFYNLPELMSMFKEVADIQTADMLNLPVPKANYHNITIEPSEIQREMVAELSERADRVRNKMVDSSVDNMLLITNDGRKLALDQRLINELLPDDERSKVASCANNIFDIWEKTKEKSLAQLVFCDLSTPKGDDRFSVYDDIKKKLIVKGVPKNEVVFIHDAETEVQKKEMFAKVRKGQIRVLIGSTQKMGAGTNCQDMLVALHDLDCPWRPSDLEQRSGRIIRQGNQNPEVDIFRYVTKDTFDAYLFQLVENKQKFISQVMTSKSPARSAEDIDETALSYAEIKALATGNPYIKEKMNLDNEVSRLKVIKSSYLSQRYALEDAILKRFPKEIKQYEERIEGYIADVELLTYSEKPTEEKFSPMVVDGVTYYEKELAGKAIIEMCKKMTSPDVIPIGTYRGFDMDLSFDTFSKEYKLTLKNKLSHNITLGSDTFGNITRIENVFDGFNAKLDACKEILENTKTQFETAKIEALKPFPQEAELTEKSARLDELNILLNMDKNENEFIESESEIDEETNAQDEKEKIVECEMVR